MCRRSNTLRGNRRYKPIFDEKGFPRGKTQNETGGAVEVSVFVPWGALSTLSTCASKSAETVPLLFLLNFKFSAFYLLSLVITFI